MRKRLDGRPPRWLGVAALGLGLAIAAVGSGIVGSGCGDSNGPDTRVYAFGRVTDDSACPPGTSEAYRAGVFIVCDSCEDDDDCAVTPREQCVMNCGPGCEDIQGCCPVSECRPIPCCPVCGDGVCEGDESACNCATDGCPLEGCTLILPTCGDGRCERGASPGESHERCPADCPLVCEPCVRILS